MDTQTFAPPVNLVEDFQALQTTIFEDKAGDRTRQLVAYFRQAEQKSLEMHLHTVDYEQKQFAKTLSDAFGASTRIVLAAWEKAHGADLKA
jgi:hypothetical protein